MTKPSALLAILVFTNFVNFVCTKNSKSEYHHVRLDSDSLKDLYINETILIECPINKLIANYKFHSKRSATITSWYRDNLKLNQFNVDQDRINIFQRILKIKGLSTSDSGVYMCEILSGSGITVRSNALTLNILGGANMQDTNHIAFIDIERANTEKGEFPVFRNNVYDSEFSLLELSSVYFDCSSTGSPLPNIRWLKNNQIISEEDYGLIGNIMQLNLNNLRVGDSGNYTCQVSNQLGKLERTFYLNVLESLKFVDNDPANKSVSLNSVTVLKCQVDPVYDEYGSTKITWYMHVSETNKLQDLSQVSIGSQAVQINGENFYEISLDIGTRASSSNYKLLSDNSLVISNINVNNIGTYLCFANSTRGYNYKQFNLNINESNLIPSTDVLLKLFKKSQMQSVLTETQNKNSWPELSLPVIFIIATSSMALVIFMALLYCYKNI